MIEAERHLLSHKAQFDESDTLDGFGGKYAAAYRRMIEPGYRFRSTSDPGVQAKLLSKAMHRCQWYWECRDNLSHWLGDERPLVRLRAHSTLGILTHYVSSEKKKAIWHDIQTYLAGTPSAERLAEGVSESRACFVGSEVSSELLARIDLNANDESPAGLYLKRVASLVRANGNLLPGDLGAYPSFEIIDLPFSSSEFGGQDTQLQKGIELKEKKDGDAVRERAQ